MKDHKTVADAYLNFMRTLEVDFKDENNKDTHNRVARYYKEFLNPPTFNFTSFPADGMDEMVIQSNIPFFSLCAHHHLPIFGLATIAYIPREEIVGLSKLARTLEYYARRFQNQERITNQVADRLVEELDPYGVAVVLKARHLCMEMRGVLKHDTWTTTSKLLGVFKEDLSARTEFLNLIR